MNVNLFPFELIEKNSRIIIYGYGDAGRQYFVQINRTKYCEILYFVDQNYFKYQGGVCQVVSADVLYEEDVDCYEYVLVAIDDPLISKNVKTMLQKNGIPEGKIVTTEETRFMTKYDWNYGNALTLKKIQEDQDALNRYVLNQYIFFRNTAKYCGEYLPDICEIIDHSSDKKQLLEVFKTRLFTMPNKPYKLILLQLMYLKECFDSDCMKMFMDSLIALESEPDTQFGLFIDSDFMIFHYPAYLYDDYYIERRKLMQEIAEKIDVDTSLMKPAESKTKLRIAICCYRLHAGNSADAYFEIVALYTSKFHELGIDVALFSLNADFEDDEDNIFLKKIYARNDTFFQKHMLGSNLKFHQCEQPSPADRMNEFVQSIMVYNPDVILDMSDDQCPPMYMLHKYFPVVIIPFRGYVSSSFFDLCLTHSKEMSLKKNAIYRSASEEQIYELKIGNIPPAKNQIQFDRGNYGFRDEDFILVTVGSRLNYDIKEDFMMAILQKLGNEPNFKWILVGDELERSVSDYEQFVSEGRIILWGYENDLDSFYQMCDVYLQPNRNGGSVSVRRAMRAGLPIAITDYPSDVRPMFQQEDVIHGGYDELMDYISLLYRNQEVYKKASDRMLQIVDDIFKQNDAEQFLGMCKMAAEQFGPQKQKYIVT